MAYNLPYILRTLLAAQATHLFLFIYFYLCKTILTPIAYIFNRSYLIQHPNSLYPSVIAPARNHTVHTFFPSSRLLAHLKSERMLAPKHRHWVSAENVECRMAGEDLPPRIISLDKDISGPQIRQGMMIMQKGGLVYVGEEIGRWPTQENLIATFSVNMQTGCTFVLFIPVHLFNTSGVRDDSPHSPFRSPLPLSEVLYSAERPHRIISLPPPPPPDNV